MAQKSPWRHAQIGIQLAVLVMGGFFAGYWADRRFGFAPWLSLLGAAAGLALGFYSILRELADDDK